MDHSEEISPISSPDSDGVPVFKPTWDQFKDFPTFIQKINHYGMTRGIVKVVPPQEWLDRFGSMKNESMVSSIRIKNPIIQHVSGVSGAFRLQNVEKQRTYTLAEWHSLCERSEHQPPAPRGSRRNSKPSLDVSNDNNLTHYDDSQFTINRCHELERAYWKTITYNSPLYGADMLGSLFTKDFESWNVANLDNLLNTLPEDIPGVNTAYLYFGMWKSTFAWHLEDMDLYSINYIHFGAPKQWYSISQQDRDKFYDIMAEIWPEEHKTCREFLRHKTFNASPSFLQHHGIKVNKLVHYQNEFVITFPYGYHAGFNYGYNCAESVNFAFDSWIDIGLKADQCHCISDSVGINVAQLIASQMEADDDDEEEEDSEEADEVYQNISDISINTREPHIDSSIPTPPHNDSCEHQKSECILCPNSGPFTLIYSKDKLVSAHRICALYIPETYSEFHDDDPEEHLAGVQDVPEERWRLRCTYCTQTKARCGITFNANGSSFCGSNSNKSLLSPTGLGACVQCAHPTCNRAFHPTCIDVSGSEVAPFATKVATNDGFTEVAGLKFFCRFHRDKRTALEDTGEMHFANESESVETTEKPWEPPTSEYARLAMEWASSLLPGDIVQLKSRVESRALSSVYGAVVQENNFSEESVLVVISDTRLPSTGEYNPDTVEVRWCDLLCPYPRMLYGDKSELEYITRKVKRRKMVKGLREALQKRGRKSKEGNTDNRLQSMSLSVALPAPACRKKTTSMVTTRVKEPTPPATLLGKDALPEWSKPEATSSSSLISRQDKLHEGSTNSSAASFENPIQVSIKPQSPTSAPLLASSPMNVDAGFLPKTPSTAGKDFPVSSATIASVTISNKPTLGPPEVGQEVLSHSEPNVVPIPNIITPEEHFLQPSESNSKYMPVQAQFIDRVNIQGYQFYAQPPSPNLPTHFSQALVPQLPSQPTQVAQHPLYHQPLPSESPMSHCTLAQQEVYAGRFMEPMAGCISSALPTVHHQQPLPPQPQQPLPSPSYSQAPQVVYTPQYSQYNPVQPVAHQNQPLPPSHTQQTTYIPAQFCQPPSSLLTTPLHPQYAEQYPTRSYSSDPASSGHIYTPL